MTHTVEMNIQVGGIGKHVNRTIVTINITHNVYDTIYHGISTARVQPVHLTNTEQYHAAIDPHTRVHRVFTDMEHPHRCWPRDWTRDQCVTVAQLRTGHSPLLAAYLHRIGCRDSATCPHCNGADETAEHLVLHCPAHDQARQESLPNLHYQSDPRRLWSFLEKIGAVTRPPDRE